MLFNVPIGLAVVAVAPLFVGETPRLPGRFDLAGALTATAGVTTLVYGFIRAASDGWSDHLALAASGLVNMIQLVGGALGLGMLVAVYGTAVGHSALTPHVVAHGIGTAFGFAAILDVCSLLVILALIKTGRLAPAVAPAARPQEEAVAS